MVVAGCRSFGGIRRIRRTDRQRLAAVALAERQFDCVSILHHHSAEKLRLLSADRLLKGNYVNSNGSKSYDRPQSRPLKIFAIDPMLGRNTGGELSIEIENELLQPGPQGERLEVREI